MGWSPRGVLAPGIENIAFSLTTDNVSDVIPYAVDPMNSDQTVYYLFMVSEKADNRPVEVSQLEELKGTVLSKWFNDEVTKHTVKFYGLTGAFDSETMAWINYQLSKK